MNAYLGMYERYAEDVAFLWLLRSLAVKQPHYTVKDLLKLDERIDTRIDGLMTAPEDAWAICSSAMDSQETGETFAAAVLALRSLDVKKIQHVVESALSVGEMTSGLVSAFGWLPGRLCHSWVKKFFTSKDFDHKYLAVSVCSIRREDPLAYLTKIFQRKDCLEHTKLYARSLRLVGELKRHDLSVFVRDALHSEEPIVQFWASWSAILLGDRALVNKLQPFVLEEGINQGRAIELAFRVLPVEEARVWIRLLSKDPGHVRNVIKAVAALGDPHAVSWLIGCMRVPSLTRLAGEAFTSITGIELEEHGLAIDELPDLDGQLPNDDPDDGNVELDPDEHLPFPNVDKVAAVWQKYQHRFIPGQRYLVGKPISSAHLADVLERGYQRQRRAAALELAILEPAQPLPNCGTRTQP